MHRGLCIGLIGLCFMFRSAVSQSSGHAFPEFTSKNVSEARKEYSRSARFEEGIQYFRDWLKSVGTPANEQDSAAWYATHACLAYLFFDIRQMDSAEVVLKPVLDVSPQRFPAECLMIKNGWGVRLIYGGRYTEGRDHFREFRELLDAGILEASPLQYCNIVHNLGVAYKQLGDIDAALEVFLHIEDLVRQHGVEDPGLNARLQFNLSGSYMAIAEYDKSIEHSRKAYALHVEQFGPDHPFSAQLLNSVAGGILMSGDKEEALKVYFESLEVFERINRPTHMVRAVILLNIAETLDKLDRPEESLPYIQNCIDIRKETYGLRHDEIARAFKAKGTILGHLGRFEEGVLCMDTALMALGYDPDSENPYSGVEAMFNLFYTLDHKADLYYDRAQEQPLESSLLEAKEAYAHGISVLNDLRVHFKGKLSKGNLNHKSYGFYEPAIDICLDLFELTGETGYLAQALLWSSESKDNDFFDLIRGEDAMIGAGVPDSVLQKHENILESLARLESAWYDAKVSEDSSLTESRRKLDVENRKYREWLASLESRYPKYYALMHAQNAPGVKELNDYLKDDNTQLLEYFLGDDHAIAFVLTGREIHAVRLAAPDSIISAVESWRSGFESGNFVQNDISKLIWQPVVQKLSPDKQLVIIPDGILHSLPFELLKNQDRSYALEHFSISYLNSARAFYGKGGAGRKNTWLGLAPKYPQDNPVLAMASRGLDSAAVTLRDMSWIRLPGAETEIKAIGEMIQGEYLLGEQATEANFRKRAGQFDILHLSMHAWTDDDEPLLSGLIFSEGSDSAYDGRLYAHEIFGLELPAKMIVLSACNTGVGVFRRGEGISSLAKAFQWAGTESTVMSLWKVPDESTATIMQAFYTHLRKGERKDEALRNAKLDYLQSVSEPELARPYYWAGFVLMGDAAPVYPRRASSTLVIVIGCIALIISIGIIIRRSSGTK